MGMRTLAANRRARRALGLATAAVTLAAVPGPGRAEDVNVTANTNSGLNLDNFAGSTVRVFPSVTVANTGTLIGTSFSGVAATTRAWILTNDGTIDAQLGNGIRFQLGGTVNNNGVIDSGFQGVALTGAGGTVNNAAGALIDAGSNGIFINNGAGMVTNAGTIRSTLEAVTLRAGGTVINQAGGLIEGVSTPNVVTINGGTTRVVVNDGIIRNTNTNAGQFPAGAKASYGARTWQLFGEAGYTLTAGTLALEPFAGLAYVSVAADGFSETGGAAALTGRGRSKSLVFSTLGLRAATRFALSDTKTLTLRGALGWRHAFGAVVPETDLAFNSPANSPFGVAGVPVARDSLALDAGAALALGARMRVGFTYSGQIAARAHSHRLALQATVRF